MRPVGVFLLVGGAPVVFSSALSWRSVLPGQRVEPADQGRRGLARSAAERCSHRRRIACLFIPLPDAEVILVGEADVRVSVSRVLAVLRGAGRAEGTVRRQQVVLDRFAAFLAGRGLDTGVTGWVSTSSRTRPGAGWGHCGNRAVTGLSRRFAGRWC